MMITRRGGIRGPTNVYPVANNTTYVKATTTQSASYSSWFTTDTSLSNTGTRLSQQWLTATASVTNQRFHIDLGSAMSVSRVYYENGHHQGTQTNEGMQNFTMQGSNDATAFATLTYATNTNWTDLTTSISALVQHVAADQADPHYFDVTEAAAYRYYAFKFANNYGATQYAGVRRIVLQVVA